MEVVRKKAIVNKDGKINLELLTDFPEGEIDVLLVFDKASDKPYPNLAEFIGTLQSFHEDPVVYQKRIRDEWG